ncbi:MAG: NAD(P)H-dependent oxidoreductase [Candidatus Omnitrophica bacterium]|nr:NAD(P)H-dependent oxidoreductase [Candidatus Omnitrophota bacterium]
MKKLLHIIATPRGEASRTLRVSRAFLEGVTTKYPACVIDELNLFKETLPPLTVERIDGKYALLSGKELSGNSRKAWEAILRQIERFLAADGYLISVPMWNFSIPYVLKHYLDVIVQPRYLFRYTPNGPEGLVKDRKMVIVTSRGGDYSAAPANSMDLQEPYLKAVLGLVGIKDLTFVNVQPMDALGPQVRDEKIAAACEAVRKLAGNL